MDGNLSRRFWNQSPAGIFAAFFLPILARRGFQWWHDDSPWDMLYHLGGNGPWIAKIDVAVGNDISPPEDCSIQQVHMMSRHAERYPTTGAGNRMLAVIQRAKQLNITFESGLDFLNDWQYFAVDPSKNHDQLTTTGPYAGTLSAFKTGTVLRSRYLHLIPSPKDGTKTIFWASDSERVIESAKLFASGFWGLDWSFDDAQLNVIPETSDLGADTLTPGDTCAAYLGDVDFGHAYGYKQLFAFRNTYLPAISARLHIQNLGITFTNSEIYSMQEMCGFEILVRGGSPWCDVFSHEEWRDFEYARDIKHFYTAGPGNRFAPAMGWLWLNATANLLVEGPTSGRLFFSFVHDGEILPMLAALDLFPSSNTIPTTHRLEPRNWHTSQIAPMSGRIIFELLSCGTTTEPSSPNDGGRAPQVRAVLQAVRPQKTSERQSGSFVRINVNDGIVALPGCDSGPGSSCPLEEFLAHVKRRGEEAGDFRKLCGLGEDVPNRITFLHQ